jgi:hypothetical protein
MVWFFTVPRVGQLFLCLPVASTSLAAPALASLVFCATQNIGTIERAATRISHVFRYGEYFYFK